ncbi:hypothetical protein MNV49_000381 [Pseudohyphozyma bogoriensis]|nr:hypothetical protein MNV49_000381 [Pseudohyphozyma bogoriensis]
MATQKLIADALSKIGFANPTFEAQTYPASESEYSSGGTKLATSIPTADQNAAGRCEFALPRGFKSKADLLAHVVDRNEGVHEERIEFLRTLGVVSPEWHVDSANNLFLLDASLHWKFNKCHAFMLSLGARDSAMLLMHLRLDNAERQAAFARDPSVPLPPRNLHNPLSVLHIYRNGPKPFEYDLTILRPEHFLTDGETIQVKHPNHPKPDYYEVWHNILVSTTSRRPLPPTPHGRWALNAPSRPDVEADLNPVLMTLNAAWKIKKLRESLSAEEFSGFSAEVRRRFEDVEDILVELLVMPTLNAKRPRDDGSDEDKGDGAGGSGGQGDEQDASGNAGGSGTMAGSTASGGPKVRESVVWTPEGAVLVWKKVDEREEPDAEQVRGAGARSEGTMLAGQKSPSLRELVDREETQAGKLEVALKGLFEHREAESDAEEFLSSGSERDEL